MSILYHYLSSTAKKLISTEQPIFTPPATTNSLNHFPGDLLLVISSFLELRSDVASLSLVSKHFHSNVTPELYSNVTLKSAEHIFQTLGMLHRRADISRHVRKLAIKLDRDNRRPDRERELASAAVRELAGSQRLDALSAFEWDAEEMPPHDDMWFALRIGCPKLRFVGTSIGFQLPPQHSHLFDFVDLHGFSLSLKPGFYINYADMFLQEDIPILQHFWDMLVMRCGNLQELSISGDSSNSDLVVIRSLLNGRWPQLRKLSLGHVCMDVPVEAPEEVHPFITFLDEHPQIQSLGLSRHNIDPRQLSLLAPGSLSRVKEFSGTLEQLQNLTRVHENLTKTTFAEPMRTREFTPTALSAVLRSMSRVTELKICFVLNSMYDSNSLLRAIVQSCPQIQDLAVTCLDKPSFQMESFSRTIRTLKKLENLKLSIVRFPGDGALSTCAAIIARGNPRLRSFTLNFLPPATSLQLPFSIPFLLLPFFSSSNCEAGRYTIFSDRHGLPHSLNGFESKTRLWPFGVGLRTGKRKTERRYVGDLRPVGYPGRAAKGGWQGLLELTMERSAAGEEVRMIGFSLVLFLLAVWGFTGVVIGRANLRGEGLISN